MKKNLHSEAVLSDRRDHWWHDDFLELLSKRLGLREQVTVLDIGCGHGHWGQRLLPLLSPSARLAGVDQEPKWVEHAAARAERLGISARCDYRVGDALHLPYPDHSFTLVTCQTVLMHVAEPEVALREMLRVVQPGGRLLLAEPSNQASHFSADTVSRALTPSQVAEVAYLLVACSRGRRRLGRGDDCMGDVLPSLLRQHGVEEISVFQNDRANVALPPYEEHVYAQLEEELSYVTSGFWLWNREDARLLFEAGDGDRAKFEAVYGSFLRRTEIFKRQVEERTYASVGASFHFVITGTTSLRAMLAP